jgi:flagellar hook-basal body complex protein FliE
MSAAAIAAITPLDGSIVPPLPPLSRPASVHPVGFGQMLAQGVEQVNKQALTADREVRAFVLDDSVPVHQVSYALEQAKLSLEFMLQIRSRMVEGYQQFMNMQL